jgi:hypothetical protein
MLQSRLLVLLSFLVLLASCGTTGELNRMVRFDPTTATQGMIIANLSVNNDNLIGTVGLGLERTGAGGSAGYVSQTDETPILLRIAMHGTDVDITKKGYGAKLINPGEYTVTNIYMSGYQTSLVTCIGRTIKFKITAGEVIYLGDYYFTLVGNREPPYYKIGGIRYSIDEAAVKDHVSTFTGVSAVPKLVKPDIGYAKLDKTEIEGWFGSTATSTSCNAK